MQKLLKKHWFVTVFLFVVGGLAFFVHNKLTATPAWTTTVVERGKVEERVAVSGFTEAVNVAELSFPRSGLVTDVFIEKGDKVTAGQLLATLGSAQLVAERAAAVATLEEVTASRQALENGPTNESRAVTSATVAAAEQALADTIATEAKRVETARASLLSNALEAIALDGDEEAVAPRISGTYTCSTEGEYIIEPYRSNTQSGYSFRFSGLESGVTNARTEQPSAFGACGLFIQFDTSSSYGQSVWRVTVPNSRSSTFLSVKNAYELALRQQAQNVASAEKALSLAQNQALAENAGPRVESLLQANASIQAAQARIAAIDAQIADASIIAPFPGIITDVSIVPGEIAGTARAVTLLGEGSFRITAKIPEIDITKIVPEQQAVVRFDAKDDEVFEGVVSFISPLPTVINTVAYFDTLLSLEALPTWIRSGLNADIDIVLQKEENVLKVPTRFIKKNGDISVILLLNGTEVTEQPITVLLTGTDGYAAITGVNEGDTIVAPST